MKEPQPTQAAVSMNPSVDLQDTVSSELMAEPSGHSHSQRRRRLNAALALAAPDCRELTHLRARLEAHSYGQLDLNLDEFAASSDEQLLQSTPFEQATFTSDIAEDATTSGYGDLPVSVPSGVGFVALLAAYRASGGTMRCEDMMQQIRARQRGQDASLLRMIAARHVLSFQWRNSIWLPLFQFEVEGNAPCARLKVMAHDVITTLSNRLDDWGKAAWFVQSNAMLAGRKPVDTIEEDFPSVLRAAQIASLQER